MEKIIPFRKSDYTPNGIHILSGKFVLEFQKDWEEAFHHLFNPYFANVLEGHASVMRRLTQYMEGNENSIYDYGMELIDGEIDLETNFKIEEFSKEKTVYAIGSRFHDDEDNPLFLIKNDNLSEDILVLKYVSDNEDSEENGTITVIDKLILTA